MASGSGIRAGLAYIELYANDARLVKGLKAAAAKLKAFGAAVQDIGTKMSLAGAAIVTPLLASAKSFSDVGDALDKMSARTGISVEALSEIGFAADQSGTSLDDVETAVRKMQKTITASASGSKQATEALSELGLSAEQLLRLSLKAAWQRGIFELNTLWLGFKEQFLSIATGAFYGAVALVAQAFYGLRTIWTQTINFWSDVLDRFAGFFIKTWNELTGFLAKKFTELQGTFDSSINVTAINKRIDQETQQKNAQVSRRNLDARLGREGDLQGIEQERKGVISAIAVEAGNVDNQRQAKFASEMADSEKALEDARSEWKAAIEQARTERSSKESEAANRSPLPDINLPDITQRAQSVLDVSGTFNTSAIAQLGVGSTATERTAKATEDTARNTKRIIQKMDEDGATFD